MVYSATQKTQQQVLRDSHSLDHDNNVDKNSESTVNLATSTPVQLTMSKDGTKVASWMNIVQNRLGLWYYRYTLVTGQYIMTTAESTVLNLLVVMFYALIIYNVYLYMRK